MESPCVVWRHIVLYTKNSGQALGHNTKCALLVALAFLCVFLLDLCNDIDCVLACLERNVFYFGGAWTSLDRAWTGLGQWFVGGLGQLFFGIWDVSGMLFDVGTALG